MNLQTWKQTIQNEDQRTSSFYLGHRELQRMPFLLLSMRKIKPQKLQNSFLNQSQSRNHKTEMGPEFQGEMGHMNCLTYGRAWENKVSYQ